MSIWKIVWVVLMVVWLLFGGYYAYDAQHPHLVAGALIPWACVAILAGFVFRGDLKA